MSPTLFYIYKGKLLNNFSKILKKNLQLFTGQQLDICYVNKTSVGCEIAEFTRFLNHFSNYSFPL